MAATGKKGKKAKWLPANLTDFIAEPTTIATTQNWADSVEDETENFGYGSRTRAPVVLPSASRAARGGNAVDDDSIPRRPPYEAHISNLPYAVDESAISELFADLKVINLRLPREGDRLKGYGYVEFEDRDSLINAMNIPDLSIGGRRIRIEVSAQDNDRRMGRNNRSDRDREYDPERTMGDWRSGPRVAPEGSSGPPRGRSDRDEGRERERGPMNREGMRERERDSSVDNKPGGWRDGDRPAAEPARTPYGGRDSFGRRDEQRDGDRGGFGGERRERGYGREGERSGYGGRDGFRTAERSEGGGGFGNRDRDRDSRGFGSRGFGDRDRERERDAPPREESKPRERPKLNLLPRTVPREPEAPQKPADGAPAEDKPAEKPVPKPVPAEKVFGAAKPVDTAAKEREIEERLRKREEEARRAGGEDKERWGRRNDDSDDRRSGARRDDRSRDNRDARPYNQDRRDYSKEDKSRQQSGERRRDYSSERHSSADRDRDRDDKPRNGGDTERNGKDEARPSRSRDRIEDAERPLPKLKEQEKPNFVGSNKFSFLEDAEDGGSD